ncbi:MAG: glycosyltransferase family 2 protein [Wenzhouxiangella sp.]|nr:glycosyltransferase family 2 protein [Wenzhouxiangella sp.]
MTRVVVPIYNAPAATQRCLAALARHTDPSTPVVLINDASTDPQVASVIAASVAEAPQTWQVVTNDTNIGFVGSANLGLALTAPDDAVLLNADAEVTEGWLDAMRACMGSDPAIASVSPLTNHGEIASIPAFCQPNPYPADPNAWARACRCAEFDEADTGWVDVPTTVGFCMLIRRSALDTVGFFDEAAFGRGYGEENDWCQRALAHGFRHVLCDRAFVAHEGGASFGPLGLAPGGQAMATLLERYPNYEADVARFIEQDPLAKRRQRIVESYQKTAHNGAP